MIKRGSASIIAGLLGLILATTLVSSEHHIQKRATACFENVGCFDDGAPFPFGTIIPESPDSILTQFNLYTRYNAKEPHKLDARHLEWLEAMWPYFDNRPTRLIVHGYVDNSDLSEFLGSSWMVEMKNEFLRYDDSNIIIVDWSNGNSPPYIQATANTRVVGFQIANLINHLTETRNMSASQFHVIGHSLGSHIAGYAGERVEGLGRISGLDPAGPQFEGTDDTVRLDKSDAVFVDAIHTDAKSLLLLGFGSAEQNGHMDFYPNLGADQPECSTISVDRLTEGFFDAALDSVACNHLRSYKFYTESINSECLFYSQQCLTKEEYEDNTCQPCSEGNCASMGFHADKFKRQSNESKKLFLRTKPQKPFCRFNFQMTIIMSDIEEAVEESGYISVTVIGSKRATAEIRLNEEYLTFKPGGSYSFTFEDVTDIGDVRFVKLLFKRTGLFIFDFPSVFIKSINVFSERSGSEVQICAGHREAQHREPVLLGPSTLSKRC